jgi:membrane-associated phospholipid phosphatase
LLIGWSRVFLGLHFPSDVAVGALLGCLLAFVVHAVLRRLKPLSSSS